MRQKRMVQWILVMAAAGTIAACGKEGDTKEETAVVEDIAEEESGQKEPEPDQPVEMEEEEPKSETESVNEPSSDSWKQRFGENCISEQTFEVELSEYSGKVCFVPFAPSGEEPDFHMQIVQGEEVLADVTGYVPKSLEGAPFQSLDAVSFFDVNYDGYTDIVLIETCKDTSFAAVYYGFDKESEGAFWAQETLSEKITRQAETLSIPAIRELLAGGKKNGEFESYQEAYEAVSRFCELETEDGQTYGLFYVDEDEIPELAAGKEGYYTSLYTYENGTVYTLMDCWPYGAMGNTGYEYAPKKNSLRNYNADYAGAIMYTTYMEIGSGHTVDTVTMIKQVNFDDVNGNGIPDEEEMDSMGYYGVSYIDEKEVTEEECAAYDVGGYEMIVGTMTREELLKNL